MKVLLATESYYPNIDGGAVAQHNLVLELKKRGHEIGVIAPGHSYKSIVEKEDGITIYRTKGIKLPLYMEGRYHFSLFPIFKVEKIIKEFNPDIVNICSPYPIGISTYICARKYKIPVVGSIHILPENMITPFHKLKNLERIEKYTWKYLIYFFNLVDWATIPTKTGLEMYKKMGLLTNITPISNGIKTETFNPNNDGEYLRKKFGLPQKNIVLYTGRINEEKNLDILINAIPYVLKKVDAHFLFVGSGGGYKQFLINLTKELNIVDNTTFTDFLDWDDYPNIYGIADLFAIPSEAELQSIVTMEAVASGLPVVVVNKGALPELANLNNGYIFESKNSKQMAEYIVKILTDEKLKNAMGENSIELIKEHSMESVAFKFEETYKMVLNKNNTNNSLRIN
jgi:glycosyltransferase involved in cell wall biosynthesis